MAWWVWVIILVVLAAIVAPIKFRVLKRLFGPRRQSEPEE